MPVARPARAAAAWVRGLAPSARLALPAPASAGLVSDPGGECRRLRDGAVFSYVSQPHVREHALHHLAAVEAYGRSRHRPGAPDALLRPARRRQGRGR